MDFLAVANSKKNEKFNLVSVKFNTKDTVASESAGPQQLLHLLLLLIWHWNYPSLHWHA